MFSSFFLPAPRFKSGLSEKGVKIQSLPFQSINQIEISVFLKYPTMFTVPKWFF